MVFQPTSLVELAARVIKVHDVPYEDWEVRLPMGIFFNELIHKCQPLKQTRTLKLFQVPSHLARLLKCSHNCVNPTCKGVFFSSKVEHVKVLWLNHLFKSLKREHMLTPLLFSNSLSTSAEGSEFHWCNTVRYISLKNLFKEWVLLVTIYIFFALVCSSRCKVDNPAVRDEGANLDLVSRKMKRVLLGW